MLNRMSFCFILFLLITLFSTAQEVNILTSGTKASLRGLSIPNDSTIWVSGSNGIVGKSTNGGTTWHWQIVAGFEKAEFRDIEAWDSNTAIIMAIAEPAYILRTTNGGINWDVVYKNDTKGMFLDAMDFYDGKYGIVIGDPIDGRIFLAVTNNGGKNWQELPENKRPVADIGEACFASSGTNIRLYTKRKYYCITGGVNSRLIRNGNKKTDLPMLKSKESTGANSMAFHKKKLMIVGGDFTKKDDTTGNFIFSNNKGKIFSPTQKPPGGYRSCVAFIQNKTWITCGLNGVDITYNDGTDFQNISRESFHVVQKSKTGIKVFLAGEKGKVGIIN